jgi:hypothetical protein
MLQFYKLKPWIGFFIFFMKKKAVKVYIYVSIIYKSEGR